MRLLIVKLSSLGDVVHAMAAVQDIRQACPDATIDWVVERGFSSLVRRCAGVNQVIECELRRWRKTPLAPSTRQAWKAFKHALQAQSYDAVIDLQGLSKSALVVWLARLSPQGKRFGLANQTEGSSFEAPARWVADVAVSLRPHIHAVDRSRELCGHALGYRVSGPANFGLTALGTTVTEGHEVGPGDVVHARRMVAMIHGTSRADKQWPLDHWQALGRRLNAAGFGVALPHGNAQELATARQIAGAVEDAQVWPSLALDAMTDALATCAGVIGVDSGLSHIAVALDLAHVQIYNFDTAWRTGPQATSTPTRDDAPAPRQCSVFAAPTPSVESVWRAWLGVSGGLAVGLSV